MKKYWHPIEGQTTIEPNRVYFKDERPLGPQARVDELRSGIRRRVDAIRPGLWRVRVTNRPFWTESGLNRYGFLKTDYPVSVPTFPEIPFEVALTELGFVLKFPLVPGERLYGLGDAGRDNLNRRGGSYTLWIKNQTCDIPIPVLLSSKGRGIFLNSTWRTVWDVGKTDSDTLKISAEQGDVDFYYFTGDGYHALLDTYTELTGRPKLLPISSYGFMFICNKWIDQFALVADAVKFRELGIPCDSLGLEGWMSRRYDFSKDKDWNPQRFNFPYWSNETDYTFIGALRRLGFGLSLWMCTQYDFSAAEEGRRKGHPIGHADDEPWFDHLRKFCDNGATAFKLDACAQFSENPKRKWANGMADLEMHNLYPVLYTREMATGFERHTGRRAMINSAGGYAGYQAFAASWAGDTGGEKPTLMSIENLAFSGQSNHSNDLMADNAAAVHFATFSPWMQQNNWDFWYQPWLLKKPDREMIVSYLKLRYELMPYIYSTAAEAARTGWPMVRPLAMVYPNDPAYDGVTGTYMFGDAFLVCAFDDEAVLPSGVWYDWFTGARHEGPKRLPNRPASGRGGMLFVKGGMPVPTWPQIPDHLEKGWNERVLVKAWPGEEGARGTFTLYEDDGYTLAARDHGEWAQTELVAETKDGRVKVIVGSRCGRFTPSAPVVVSGE